MQLQRQVVHFNVIYVYAMNQFVLRKVNFISVSSKVITHTSIRTRWATVSTKYNLNSFTSLDE
jgi:hypothetical protein